MKKTILGLDLGTTSMGWALLVQGFVYKHVEKSMHKMDKEKSHKMQDLRIIFGL